MKFPQLRQFCFFNVSHILGNNDVFTQVLCIPFLKTFFSLKNQKGTTTTASNKYLLTHSICVANPYANLIFNWHNLLSLQPYRKNEESIQSNEGSFNLLIFPNGL